MTDDSPYRRKDEDDLAEPEPVARTDDSPWARYRAHRDDVTVQKNALASSHSTRETSSPSRRRWSLVWILLTLVILGGLSVLSLVLGSAAMDDDAVSMDPGQVFQGIGVGGIALTLIVIVVIIIVTSSD